MNYFLSLAIFSIIFSFRNLIFDFLGGFCRKLLINKLLNLDHYPSLTQQQLQRVLCSSRILDYHKWVKYCLSNRFLWWIISNSLVWCCWRNSSIVNFHHLRKQISRSLGRKNLIPSCRMATPIIRGWSLPWRKFLYQPNCWLD